MSSEVLSQAPLFCVFGHPVAHSQSPRIHQRFGELCGIALRYERRLAPLEGFADALAAFRADGGVGCNVTLPFKAEAAALAAVPSERVRQAGAANTLWWGAGASSAPLHADNTDGIGWVHDMTVHAGQPLQGLRVLIIGAGGATAGLLATLLAERPRSVHIVNRTLAKAVALQHGHADLAAQHGVELTVGPLTALTDGGLPAPFDLVINASSSSLQGEDLPLAPALFAHGAWLCDLMYGAPTQARLERAQAAVPGLRVRDGLGMLVAQAAEAFRIWHGAMPPSAQVLDELRAEFREAQT